MQNAFQGFICWKNERISEVINKEATSVDTATFLATHTPINKLTYERTLKQIPNPSENGLLNELRRCANENEHAFVVIRGEPGTGKSHLIRWLKERYTTIDEQNECTVFIERANCSLRGTLEQIIRSGAFDDSAMNEQLKRLRNARSELSEMALSETLLDNIKNAACEGEIPKWLARGDRLRKLLLDYTVREELMIKSGPIARIAKFLSQGQNAGLETNEIPKFTSDDFIFKSDVRRKMRSGPADAQEIADDLYSSEEKRIGMANYLNLFIGIAIGRTTKLSSDDFKNIFYDLRCYLYQQKRQLALFIEDITALTGIDTGLIDVLATQHKRSTDEQEYCRLISVIGITDSYYHDYLPTNMKDRVTHRIAMSEDTPGKNATDLLANQEATAEMAARYLNAIRLERKDIEQWAHQGADEAQLPNACDTCSLKAPCHQAFGSQKILVDNSKPITIGLYPFNTKSLWTFYQHVSYSRTPRTFLNAVLHYILQSHGLKIKNNQFPPAIVDLGGEFETFWLNQPMQRNLLISQGKQDAKRIETLVTIWGDGTINAYQDDGRTYIGRLSTEIFHAFGILPIQGETQLPHSSNPQPKSNQNTAANLFVTTSIRTKQQTAGDALEVYESTISERDQQRYKHLAEWLNGGTFHNYEEYLELLQPLIRNFIDWDFYGISQFQVDEVLKGRRRIQIEGQAGRINTTHYISFARSSELGAVLQGLAEMKERQMSLDKAVIGGYLTNFSIWLHQHESEIVQFVRQPNRESKDILPFTTIIVLDCLLLACLSGTLQPNYETTAELYQDLVKFCVSTTEISWSKDQQETAKVHSQAWADLIGKRLKPKIVANVCLNFRRMLNCAQGGSPEIIFLDAAAAIRILDDFRRARWQLPELSFIGTTNLQSWEEAISIYTALKDFFPIVLQEDYRMIQEQQAKLQDYIGEAQPKEVIQSLTTFSDIFSESHRGTSFNLRRTLSANRLTSVQSELNGVLRMKEQYSERLILRLSNIDKIIDTLKEFLDYFAEFEKEASRQCSSLQNSHDNLLITVDPEIAAEHNKVTIIYDTLIMQMESISEKERVE